MSATVLRKIQLGREVTAGTAVAATSIWRGLGVPDDQREVVFPEEHIGYLGGVDRSYTAALAAALEMEEVEATFEQLLHIFEASIKTVGTGVADGAGSGKIYAYTLPTTTANTIKTYTIEGGNPIQAREMEYSHVQEWQISGAMKEALKMSATWIGRQWTNTTFTGALSVPSVDTILFNKGKLYLNTSGGTFGGTNIANTLIEMAINYQSGIVPKFTADGNLYFSYIGMDAPEITVDLTYEHNASAETERTAYEAETPRLLRLNWDGPALTTAGTAYTYKTLRLDLAGKYESFEKLDERDGNDIVSCTFRGRYNATAGAFGTVTLVNELATVP